MSLTEPYVTKALLHKLFGAELAGEVAARYFIEGQGPGGFRFRPEYYSEKVRVGHSTHVQQSRPGLLDHVQNRVLQ
jgi:hypothetical protein